MDILNWAVDNERNINENYKVDISGVGDYLKDNYDEFTDDAKTSCIYTFINYVSSVYYNYVYMRNNTTSLKVNVIESTNELMKFDISLEPRDNNPYLLQVLKKEFSDEFMRFEIDGSSIKAELDCKKPNTSYESVKYGLVVKNTFNTINEGVKGVGTQFYGNVDTIMFEVDGNRDKCFEPMNESTEVSHYTIDHLKKLSDSRRHLVKLINKIDDESMGVVDPAVRLVIHIDSNIESSGIKDRVHSYKIVMRYKNSDYWTVDVRFKLNSPIEKSEAEFMQKLRSSGTRPGEIIDWADKLICVRTYLNLETDRVKVIQNNGTLTNNIAIDISKKISRSNDPDVSTLKVVVSKPDKNNNVGIVAVSNKDGVLSKLHPKYKHKTRSAIIARVNGDDVVYNLDINSIGSDAVGEDDIRGVLSLMMKKSNLGHAPKIVKDILSIVGEYKLLSVNSGHINGRHIKSVKVIIAEENPIMSSPVGGVVVKSSKKRKDGTHESLMVIDITHYTNENPIDVSSMSTPKVSMSRFLSGIPKNIGAYGGNDVKQLALEIKYIAEAVIKQVKGKIDKDIRAEILTRSGGDGHFDIILEYSTTNRTKLSSHESSILFNHTTINIVGGKIESFVIRSHSATTKTKFSLGIFSPIYPDDKGFRSISVIPVKHMDKDFFESLIAHDNANRLVNMVEALMSARRYSGTLGDTPEERIVKDISRSGLKVKKNASKRDKLEVRKRASGDKYVVDKAKRIVSKFNSGKMDDSIKKTHISPISELLVELRGADDKKAKSITRKIWKHIINLPIYESIYESKIKKSINITGIQSADDAANHAFASWTEYMRITHSYDRDISEIGIKKTNGLPVYADDKMGLIYMTFIPSTKFESIKLAKSWYETKEMGGIKVLDVFEQYGDICVSIVINVAKAFTWSTAGYNGASDMYESIKNYLMDYESLGVDSDLSSRLICEHIVCNTGVVDDIPTIGLMGSDVTIILESSKCFTTGDDEFIRFKLPLGDILSTTINN